MSDHTELVNVLRCCGKKYFSGSECKNCARFGTGPLCDDKMKMDAADAIERLQYQLEKYHERVVYLEEKCRELPEWKVTIN